MASDGIFLVEIKVITKDFNTSNNHIFSIYLTLSHSFVTRYIQFERNLSYCVCIQNKVTSFSLTHGFIKRSCFITKFIFQPKETTELLLPLKNKKKFNICLLRKNYVIFIIKCIALLVSI